MEGRLALVPLLEGEQNTRQAPLIVTTSQQRKNSAGLVDTLLVLPMSLQCFFQRKHQFLFLSTLV